MPKIDIETIPQSNATGYPPPFDDAVKGRWWRRLAPVAGLTAVPSTTVRPVITKSYPDLARAMEIPRPIPRLAPVTIATGRRFVFFVCTIAPNGYRSLLNPD